MVVSEGVERTNERRGGGGDSPDTETGEIISLSLLLAVIHADGETARPTNARSLSPLLSEEEEEEEGVKKGLKSEGGVHPRSDNMVMRIIMRNN